jgi:hypothetical protein
MKRESDQSISGDSKYTRFGRRGLLTPFATLVLISILTVGLTGCMDGANQSPNCYISVSPSFGKAPINVTFTMSADDVDGYVASWTLDVDGNGDPEYSGDGGPPQTLKHTYQSSIAAMAELKVKDDRGASAKAGVAVSIL